MTKIDFQTFSDAASSHGYIAKQSGSVLMITTLNNVRVEWKQTSNPKFTVGFGRNRDCNNRIMEALGNSYGDFDIKTGGFFHVKGVDLARYWDLVSDIEHITDLDEGTKKPASDTPKAKKTPAKIKARPVPFTDKPKIKHLTVEEINDMKNKKVPQKKPKAKKEYDPARIAAPAAPGVDNFDPKEALAYVEAVNKDIENFKTPEHLIEDTTKVA